MLPARDQTDGGEILRHAGVYITGAQNLSRFFQFKKKKSNKNVVDFMLKHFKRTSVFVQHFMKPLKKFLQPEDIENIFINIEVINIDVALCSTENCPPFATYQT